MNKDLQEFLEKHHALNEYHLLQLRQFVTKNSLPVKGALALPIGVATNAKTVLSNSAGRCVGWSIKEATGAAAAELDLLDGTNVDGNLLFPITLAAGESSREWFGPSGISFGVGLFTQLVSGSVTGTVWIGAVD